jgi:hypothetical protein
MRGPPHKHLGDHGGRAAARGHVAQQQLHSGRQAERRSDGIVLTMSGVMLASPHIQVDACACACAVRTDGRDGRWPHTTVRQVPSTWASPMCACAYVLVEAHSQISAAGAVRHDRLEEGSERGGREASVDEAAKDGRGHIEPTPDLALRHTVAQLRQAVHHRRVLGPAHTFPRIRPTDRRRPCRGGAARTARG